MADLPLRNYSNQAPLTTLNGAITAAATTLTVNTSANFPAVPFTIECEQEVMLVTDVTGFVFTVTRAYDGSVPATSHPNGAEVKHVLTADDFEHRSQDVNLQHGTHSLDDEFGDLSIDLDWVEVTPSGTVTWTEGYGVLSVAADSQNSADCVGLVKPATSIAIGTGVQVGTKVMAIENYGMAGPLFSAGNTTTHDVIWQMPFVSPDTADSFNISLRSGTFDNITTTHYSIGTQEMVGGWLHQRLVWVTVNTFRAWYSLDGVTWTDFGQGTFTNTSVSPPTHMGMGVSTWGGVTNGIIASFSYFRVWEP